MRRRGERVGADVIVPRVWTASGLPAALARGLLLPGSLLFGTAAAARNRLYAGGVLRSLRVPVPVISVGNLTVGGTGKTPVAAFLAARLRVSGRTPALVTRGYGSDEVEVHRRLNPGIPVVAGVDRVTAARNAIAEHRADVIVVDDGFQHRRLARDVDMVLLSADTDMKPRLLLPAGPWREGLGALRRADLVAVTRKAASDAVVESLRRELQDRFPALPQVVFGLYPSALRTLSGELHDVTYLRDRKVLMIAGIANPAALQRQLELAGCAVVPAVYPDHHEFTPREMHALARRAEAVELTVCTLKDAVKLERLWPRDSVPLWYFSQSVEVEAGEEILTEMLAFPAEPQH